MKWTMCTLFMALLIPHLGFSQLIIDVTADVSSDPNTGQIVGVMDPGHISRIETEAPDQEGLVTIKMYFKHCWPFSIAWPFDTIVTVAADFPYDLMVLTYIDTNTVSSGPNACQLEYLNVIPVDTFHLSAAQILSTREWGEEPQLKLFPNPVVDRLHLKASAPWHKVVVYSAGGSRVMEAQYAAQEGEILVGHLPQGMYIMVLYGRDGAVMGKAKFVKSP